MLQQQLDQKEKVHVYFTIRAHLPHSASTTQDSAQNSAQNIQKPKVDASYCSCYRNITRPGGVLKPAKAVPAPRTSGHLDCWGNSWWKGSGGRVGRKSRLQTNSTTDTLCSKQREDRPCVSAGRSLPEPVKVNTTWQAHCQPTGLSKPAIMLAARRLGKKWRAWS